MDPAGAGKCSCRIPKKIMWLAVPGSAEGAGQEQPWAEVTARSL